MNGLEYMFEASPWVYKMGSQSKAAKQKRDLRGLWRTARKQNAGLPA